MTNQEGNFSNKFPMFARTNYAFQKVRMRNYIMSLGVAVWDVMMNGCKNADVLVNIDDTLKFSYNAKAMNTILSRLPKYQFVKCIYYDIDKEIWDKMMDLYLITR